MTFHFSTEIRVRLPETDAFGIVFHGYFFTFFDVARMDYLRNLKLIEKLGTGVIVHAEADFKSPARFDDELVVHARIGAFGRTSFPFEFRVTHKRENRLVAEGRTVHVTLGPDWRPRPVSDEFKRVVEEFERGAAR
jgi:acyl-CoA thioester hydrolase